jgi:hypothetical protein
MSMRRWAATLIATTMLAACSSGAPGPSPAPSATVASSPTASSPPIPEGAFGPVEIQSAVEELANAGVETRTLPSDAAPITPATGDPSALQFLKFQVRNMALEAAAGAGSTGADLDAATTAAGGGPVTPLLDGWMQEAGTPASELAASALRGQDLEHPGTSVIPTLALAAFVADATRGGTDAGAQDIELAAFRADDFCSEVTSYLEDVLAQVADPQAQFKVPWLQAIIDQYAPMYANDPARFRRTVGALALLAYATSIARSWTITANGDPPENTYSIEGEDPVEGDVNVTVDAGSGALADEVQPCAELAGIELGGAPTNGASLFWDPSGLSPHASPSSADPELDENAQASLTYEMTAESKEAADQGTPQSAQMSVLVVVNHEEMRTLAGAVAKILLGPNTGAVSSAVKQLYLKMQPKLAAMMFPSAVAEIGVTFHTTPSPSPSPSPTDVGVTGTWAGTWQNDNGAADGGAVFTIVQQGTSISGTTQVSGETCVRHGVMTGSVHGNRITAHIEAIRDLDLEGTIDGDSMAGTWSGINCGPPFAPPGVHVVVTGTWEATRTK